MHNIVTVERDYTKLYDKFICLGKNAGTDWVVTVSPFPVKIFMMNCLIVKDM